MPEVIGVVGAGTMGAGIAQLAAAAGARTLLHDPVPEARERGLGQIADGLERWRTKGRLEREPGEVAGVAELDALAEAGLVIEAAPERLELKRELFAALSAVAPAPCWPPTPPRSRSPPSPARRPTPGAWSACTSSTPRRSWPSSRSSRASTPRREALDVARATGRAMGKHVIDATDGPGFLVNRCNRPFGLEALKLLQERVADVETIDAIARAAGFRMGPFELQDLVGIDVGYEVSLSFHELSFGEPRWRPSPLSARMVAAGRLGRKTGRGWYEYPRERRRGARAAGARRRRRPARGGGRRARRRPGAARAGGAAPASTRATRTRSRARSRGC